jgi:hypothetical protein
VIAATRAKILDEIVPAAAAYGTPMTEALYRLKGEQSGAPQATLFVDGRKVPAGSAAYVQLANLLDADETMHNRMHTLSSSDRRTGGGRDDRGVRARPDCRRGDRLRDHRESRGLAEAVHPGT